MLVLAACVAWLGWSRDVDEATIPRGPFVGALADPATSTRELPADDAADLAPDATESSARPADPNGQDRVYDPQRHDSEAHFPTSGDGGTPAPFAAVLATARVRTSDGPTAAGSPCEVRVLPVARAGFNCVVRVLCAGDVLYPNASQTAGYLTCEVRDGQVRGAHDDAEDDGDPRLRLDLDARRAEVRSGETRVEVAW